MRLATAEFTVERLGFYLMGHTFKEFPFLQRVYRVARRIAEIDLVRKFSKVS